MRGLALRPAAAETPSRRRILTRGIPTSWPPAARAMTLAVVVIGAAMVATSAVIHLHLWLAGYRHVHLVGPLFLAQSVAGILLAVVLVAYRRLVVIGAGVAYTGGSVVALLLSASVGFLGLHDGLGVPWAGWSLATELIGLLALSCAGIALLRAR